MYRSTRVLDERCGQILVHSLQSVKLDNANRLHHTVICAVIQGVRAELVSGLVRAYDEVVCDICFISNRICELLASANVGFAMVTCFRKTRPFDFGKFSFSMGAAGRG